MASTNLQYYLVKIERASGWLLLLLVLGYILTGLNMCGDPGFAGIGDPKVSLEIHRLFRWPLVVLFAAHASVTIYFALRRWGWIKTRNRSTRPSRQPG